MRNLINIILIFLVFVAMISAQFPWNLDRIDSRERTFDFAYHPPASGQGVKVYVVDSGISNLAEFGGRVINGNGTNCSGHGTGVAGVIGSSSYGVAKQVTLVSVKVYCTGTAFVDQVVKGLDWVKKDCARFQRSGGRCVVNISLSGTRNLLLDRAAQSLIDIGAVVVTGAGNDGNDACYSSPSAVRDAIVVGGSTSDDLALSYSNFGSCVDLYAPAEGVWTVWNDGQPVTYMSGTSFAAPHVSGLAAMYLERYPWATPREVEAAIVSNATSNVILGADPNLFVFIF